MEKSNKIGTLTYIAKGNAKGCKFKDEPDTWYNPESDAAKAMIKEEMLNKVVEIILSKDKKTEFSSISLVNEESSDQEAEQPEEQSDNKPTEDKEIERESLPFTPGENVLSDLSYAANIISRMRGNTENYTRDLFKEMEQTKLDTAKKGTMGLTYASWSEAWGALKRIDPTATYQVHENKAGMPFFNDKDIGAFVKVSVKVMGLTHTVHLPVMDHSNKSVKGAALDTFIINKNIMRAFTKAIAMHGIGLYVFKGEDYPEEDKK